MNFSSSLRSAAMAVQGKKERKPQVKPIVASAKEGVQITELDAFMFKYFGKESPIIPLGESWSYFLPCAAACPTDENGRCVHHCNHPWIWSRLLQQRRQGDFANLHARSCHCPGHHRRCDDGVARRTGETKNARASLSLRSLCLYSLMVIL
eukprot:763193-Hanusia_phi.AAC.2